MTPLRTFHRTARGSLHILRNAPCEDSSSSYSDKSGRYYIAVVSDGHGDAKCFRSQYGSKFATDIAIESLKEFAEYAIEDGCTSSDLVNDPSKLRRLTDTVVARWYDTVIADFHNALPTTEELEIIGVTSAEGLSDDSILHIYGATLIAALWLPDMLILLQQGDGRCDVFYNDGTVNQPIPWDDRCINTTTTSLCDLDADESFRSCVLDFNNRRVAACYLACDGIEDAYRDSITTMEGTHTFFKDLSCKLMKMDDRAFDNYLNEFLPEFSRNGLWGKSGSGDDCSVAGIVDMNLLSSFEAHFLKDIQNYKLSEELFWKKQELNGKTRKYEILRRRMEEAGRKYDEAKSEKERMKRRLTSLRVRQSDLLASLKEENNTTEQMLQSSRKATSALEEALNDESTGKIPLGLGMLDSVSGFIKQVFSISSLRKNSSGKRRKTQAQIYKEFQDCALQCSKNAKELEAASKDVEEKKTAYIGAAEKFQAYETAYKAIEKTIEDIQTQIRDMEGISSEVSETVVPITPEESDQTGVDSVDEVSPVINYCEEQNNISSEVPGKTENTDNVERFPPQQFELINDNTSEDYLKEKDTPDKIFKSGAEETIDNSFIQNNTENIAEEQMIMRADVKTSDDHDEKLPN